MLIGADCKYLGHFSFFVYSCEFSSSSNWDQQLRRVRSKCDQVQGAHSIALFSELRCGFLYQNYYLYIVIQDFYSKCILEWYQTTHNFVLNFTIYIKNIKISLRYSWSFSLLLMLSWCSLDARAHHMRFEGRLCNSSGIRWRQKSQERSKPRQRARLVL